MVPSVSIGKNNQIIPINLLFLISFDRMTKHTDFKYTVADDKQSDDKFFFSSSHASDITKNLNHNREQELMSHGTSRNQSNKTVFAVIPAA